ncbi:MAG: peptidoglycan endopeptidase [Desulfobacterales bacterium]|nr:peptidoglycan endopeptidase [Desulfobacterales bacterium]
MKRILAVSIILLSIGSAVWASHPEPTLDAQTQGPVDSSPRTLFQQHIPGIAEQYIGMPFQMGGNPRQTGSTDNSSLFYAIYATAAQRAGLTYRAYLPMRYLLENTSQVDEKTVQNGDLIVLDNNLAAMVYQVEPSGRLHFIYASEKRQQVIAFHSDNLVYQAYWVEHLRGFFRLNPDMLSHAR